MKRSGLRSPLMLGVAASRWLLLAVVLGACTSSPAPASGPTVEADAGAAAGAVEVDPAVAAQQRLLEQELEWLVRERGLAPGALGLLRTPNGTTVAAIGDAVLEPPRAMAPDEPWPVVSITKTFTAVVVLQLVSEGALSLDDPVDDWLPGVLPADNRVTVGHLLSHRSGIVEDPALHQRCQRWTADEYLAYAFALPTSPPGANFKYSNVGYVALGRLVVSTRSARARHRPRTTSSATLGTRMATSSTARCSRANRRQSCLSGPPLGGVAAGAGLGP
jgi:D-alanyl-D-alanine carboxypeptidase